MSATLCIQISSAPDQTKQEVEFFHARDWTTETELLLMQRVHELFIMLRPLVKSVRLEIDVEVSDPSTAIFLINKKATTESGINTQKLSVREIEVLGLIMQGYTNIEIAEKLFISYETVRSHRKNLLIKTGAKNTASLINYYHQTFFEK